MLSSFKVTNTNGLSQDFFISDTSNGYQVLDVTGLDPVPANLVSTAFANMEGEQYQSSRREKRNILITLRLQPDYVETSVNDLRNNLYQFFMPKSQVTLEWYRSDGSFVTIQGYVETFDAPIFTKDPVVTISVICFDPDFVTTKEQMTLYASSNATMTDVEYEGTVDSGFEIELWIMSTIKSFTIQTQAFGEPVRSFIFNGTLIANDVLRISTVPGKKEVVLVRSATEKSFLSGISPFSSWLSLKNGINKLRVQTPTANNQLYILSYLTRFGGL